MSLIDAVGLWPTFCVCLGTLYFWMWIFDRYYKRRWPHQMRGGREGGKEGGKKRLYEKGRRGGRGRLDTEEEEAELELLGINKPPASFPPPSSLPPSDSTEDPFPPRPLPSLSEPSTILSKAHIKRLVASLPERDAMRKWVKVYCMSRDGASLSTLLYKVMAERKLSSFLLVIEDSWGYVFGGYCPCPFQNATGYYGTGESFVFKFHPQFTLYKWTGKNDYFILSNAQHLAMGGGGGFAFQLDDELDTGVSGPSDTYGNTRLSSRHVFKCLSIEVWGFGDIHD
ncbi:oxidation resistance protein 1 [Nannochloropsis gaditana]|uniref:Oxidation resistance protein 1 n=1 Tax=Nannochloropsis gaditana TaxID=72520 RepID=W7U6I5_9STRA|nr:oxidation resistance protein 1 [Nannochloropsis gaditana]